MKKVERRVLWSATLGPVPLPQRIEAAAANGYQVLSLSLPDYQRSLDAGLKPRELRQRAHDRGVELSILDGAMEWHPHLPPKRPLGGQDFTVDDIFRVGEAFEITSLNALAPFPTALPLEGLAEHFARLCDRAAERGWRVHFEFTPRSPVADIATASELVRLADRPNGGILFDTWHFFRVNPDFEALARVPRGRIFAVQVSDGAAELKEGLIPDTFRHRLLPGDGAFDLPRVLRALDAVDGLSLVGPEVLSVELFALPPVEAARRAAESLDRLLAMVSAPEA